MLNTFSLEDAAFVVQNTHRNVFIAVPDMQEYPLPVEPPHLAEARIVKMGDKSQVEIVWTTFMFGPKMRATVVTAMVDYGKELDWACKFVKEKQSAVEEFFENALINFKNERKQ